MFTLIKNAQKNADEKLTTFFENKTRFLINEFFPASFLTDLSDIFGAAYLLLMHCPAVIMKKKCSIELLIECHCLLKIETSYLFS